MRKKGFKLISILLLAVMLLSACDKKADTTTSTEKETTTTEQTTDATTSSEPVDLTVMIWDRGSAAAGTTNEENGLTKYIQEQMLAKYNINVKYMAVPRSGSDDKLNVMMAGGNAPDIVFTYSQSLFADYASNGGLTDLTAALAANGTNINQYIGNIQNMGIVNDTQFAIMKRRGQQVPRHIAYIRQDWVDAVGMKTPTTKAELEQVLLAFKEKNPGNVDGVIPWAMGGAQDTEKFYLNFIGSYVPKMSEKDAYVYSEQMKIFAPGALDGLKEMNRWFNEGLISPNFAVDTTTDQYKSDVSTGKAGFLLDDSTAPFDYISALKETVPTGTLVPVNVFDTPEGEYINPTEPLFGMYLMVPATSSDKADAAVKYLDWLADPTNAENVANTPDHTVSAAGVPVGITAEQAAAKGYPGNTWDYNIVNDHFAFVDDKAAVVESMMGAKPFEAKEWYENLYDVMNVNQFVYPAVSTVLDVEAENIGILQTMAIEYVYKLISCPQAEFDALQKEEYQKLVDSGLEDVFNARAEFYDKSIAK